MLKPFCSRGGLTDIHSHGWGLAWYHANAWNVINETEPACTSNKATEIIPLHLDTAKNLICHIRYATVGAVSISNVHPFKRKLFSHEFVFAHNGDVPMFDNKKPSSLSEDEGSFRPVGETDSEFVFCTILNHLQANFDSLPSLAELHVAIEEICFDIAQEQEGTILNFLLGIGDVIFAFSWPGARKGSTTWNGLFYTLKNADNMRATCSSGSQVAVITTKPLTDDQSWTEFKKGDLILFVNGRAVSSEKLHELEKYEYVLQ